MDKTKEYILQCEKAVEVQERTLLDGDFFYQKCGFAGHPKGVRVSYNDGKNYRTVQNEDFLIWLPRQDQLQGMVLNHSQHGYNNSGILVGLSIFAESRDLNKVSMEQLWLAFVMKERWDKIWDGKDWRKDERT